MAKATFTFSAPQKVTKEKAEQTAKTNDSKTSNFDINAETDEVLTLTGEIFESVWVRSEEGKQDQTGTTLLAGAKGANGQNVQIPFGLFKTANRLASGGAVVNCKALFSKRETQQTILNFCKKNTKVRVTRYVFFREGANYESEITKVISAE